MKHRSPLAHYSLSYLIDWKCRLVDADTRASRRLLEVVQREITRREMHS